MTKHKKKILTIIPARMGSSRFPGKPLKKINGKSMIQIILEQALSSKLSSYVFVATCDKQIADHVNMINGNVIMTSSKHERASDRCAEAMRKLEKKLRIKFDIVVMIQGDEPMISSKMIDKSILPFYKDKSIQVANLLGKIKDNDELCDPSCIKVVIDKFDNAIYFSREPIPSSRNYKNKVIYNKQVCVIPFKRDFLIKYNKLKETKLEKAESIDMLRVIENNYKIKMIRINKYTHAVDTPSDLKLVSKLMKI